MKTKQQIIDEWGESKVSNKYLTTYCADKEVAEYWLNIIEEEKEALRREIREEIKQLLKDETWRDGMSNIEITLKNADVLQNIALKQVLSLPSLSTPKQSS